MDVSGEDSPFADVKVRQAVNHVIDKENIIRLQNGRAEVLDCIFPTLLPGYDPDCHPYPRDVDRAKALMAEANSTGFSTQLYTDTTEISELTAQAIATDVAQLGIEVEVITQDFDVLLGTITKPHEAPMVYIGWFQDFPDPSDFIDPILSCAAAQEGGANASWYCNEDIDADAAAARQIASLDEAIPVYQDIQDRIMADAPWAPLVTQQWTILVSERVQPAFYLHPVWYYELARYAVAE
jgi:ABC-type transport system substrate-binding protein